MSGPLPKAFVFGAGAGAYSLLGAIRRRYEVIALLDNDEAKWNTLVEGIPVRSPGAIFDTDYDIIVIAAGSARNPIAEQLIGMGVPYGCIDSEFLYAMETPRVLFLEKLGELLEERGVPGCAAEAGVYRGAFAREINRVFPARKFFLFDTFSGFDTEDAAMERDHRYSRGDAGFFSLTSEALVLEQMPHPEVCVIRKGYFPASAKGLEEVFCFVNLDLDLYRPTLAGLAYFYPRMATGGVILVHDYFSDEYKGVKAAVRECERAAGRLRLFPVGDLSSIGIQC
ncbi:MAG: methyltransferase [Deltaproteobacteria bacterium]|jgi:hypothetical protein|nr:methyltransferase [Deltaproteobacteria bacterium]